MDIQKLTDKPIGNFQKITENQFLIVRNESIERYNSTDRTEIQNDFPKRQISVISEAGKIPKSSPYKAFSYTLISGFCLSVTFLLGKLTDGFDAAQSSTYSSLGVLLFILPIAAHKNESFIMEKVTFALLLLRGAFAGGSVFLGFMAFRALPLGDASVIIFSAPVFVTILARIFFKERCSRIDILNIIFTLLGLVLVTKLPRVLSQPEHRFTHEYIIGILAAFGSLFCVTALVLVTRQTKSVHYSVVGTVTAFIEIIVCYIINAFTGKFTNPCGQEYYPIVLGLLGFMSRISFIRAVQLHNAGPISTLRSCSDIAFAFIWQVTLFGEIPDAYASSGAVLVIISILLIGLKFWIYTLPEESVVKQKAKFFIT